MKQAFDMLYGENGWNNTRLLNEDLQLVYHQSMSLNFLDSLSDGFALILILQHNLEVLI